MQVAVAPATQLCQPHVGRIGKLQCAQFFLALKKKKKSPSNMAVNGVGRKFESDLQKALQESLALFLVDKLKAEQRLIIENIVARNISKDGKGNYTLLYENLE